MNVNEESNNEMDKKSLSKCFDEAVLSFEDVCNCKLPTKSSDVQYKVKKCMNQLEHITRMVSVAGIFSKNELIMEVPTNDLKFMLLPSFLGTLTLKLTTNGQRRDIVSTAEAYFKDFLQRCKDYELTDVDIVIVNAEPSETSFPEIQQTVDPTIRIEEQHACPDWSLQNLATMARTRAQKIQQYHRQKELECELETLKAKLSECSDDGRLGDEDVKREYYLALIKSHITKAVEELDCLQSEKMILARTNRPIVYDDEHFRDKGRNNSDENDGHMNKGKRVATCCAAASKYSSKPLQPVIITRDQIQKKIFGAGYPSLPTMTVTELCEQRLQDGTWSTNNAASLQDMAKNEQLKKDAEQKEVIARETAIENDDHETLERLRFMDDYKDNHKRGWGNRYNRS